MKKDTFDLDLSLDDIELDFNLDSLLDDFEIDLSLDEIELDFDFEIPSEIELNSEKREVEQRANKEKNQIVARTKLERTPRKQAFGC